MDKRTIIHMFDPMPHTSPFDINMAADAGFDVVVPYNNVELDRVHRLVQDAIFSRGPAGVKRTAIFIGGRDIGLAMAMLAAARKAMVPPFQVSVLADPSGAFTTAAALVACVERELNAKHGAKLDECRAVAFGGTGPVGIATGVIASLNGAQTTLVDHLSSDNALAVANEYNHLCGCSVRATYASSDADKAFLLSSTDVVFSTAKAGIEVLNAAVLAHARQLKVAGDVNAVPPLGIEGIKIKDFGAPLKYATASKGAVGIGALAVGDVKYKLQQALLRAMLEAEQPVYLDFRDAFQRARCLV
ncbi:MAG: NAD(P)-dependent methylenetetrahydromethanopterin dehydrogenase [Chromatiales bacterium]